MDVILNERSLDSPAERTEVARVRMKALVDTLRAVRAFGADGAVRTVKGIHVRELAEGYRISNWLSDGTVGRDLRELFGQMLGGAPYVPEMLQTAEDEARQLFEYRLEGTPAYGLGLADLLDTLAVSLQGNPIFEQDPVCVQRCAIGDGRGGDELEELEVEICNLSRVEQAAAREVWIAERLAAGVQDGEDLWGDRAVLFPHLTFCGDARRQILGLHGTEPSFRQILRHLRILNATTRDWMGGEFAPVGVGATPESDQTLKHGIHGPKRVFETPEGRLKFSWHTKLIGANQRIYFMLRPRPTKTTYVPYIGPHLSTVRYPDLA